MPYHVGAKGSYGCSGYPALKDDGTVMGCHKTRGAAARQIYAINVSEGNIGKAMVKEGDMVMAPYEEGEVHVGRVVHVMTDGMLGYPGSEYSIMASAEEPAVLIQLFEMEEGGLEETEYFVGHKASEVMVMPSLESNVGMDKSMHEDEEDEEDDEDMNKEYEGCGCPTCKELNVSCENCPECNETMKDCCGGNVEKEAPCWDGYVQRGMKPGKNGKMVPNCVPVSKADNPNYGEMIKPRRGGSEPSNAKLYAQIIREAKDKFDTYPSAVANAWVVQEYKRRGGTYKSYDKEDKEKEVSKGVWGGSLFDLNGFQK